MNMLKEAHSFIGFATYYPLLYKSTSDDNKPTSGYAIEEVIKISFLSSLHRLYLVDFLLDKLLTSRWPGKQKVVRILLQLSKRGHYEIRVFLRQKDSILRKAASQGCVPDPVLANTPELFLNSAIQELLVCIFDPSISKSDEEKLQRRELEDVKISNVTSGYGSSSKGSSGKYEGFGNAAHVRQDSIVNQVYEIVGNAMTSSEKNREAYLKSLMTYDKGNYKPVPASSLVPLPPLADPPPLQTSGIKKYGPPIVYSNLTTSRGKAHVAGRAGGGWASDEEDEVEGIFSRKISLDETAANIKEKDSMAEEGFIKEYLGTHSAWPIKKFVVFLKTDTQIKDLNKEKLLSSIVDKINKIMDTTEKVEKDDIFLESNDKLPKLEGNELEVMLLLLFIEWSFYSWIDRHLVNKICFLMLTSVGEFKWFHSHVRYKAQKLCLLLKGFMSKHPVKD